MARTLLWIIIALLTGLALPTPARAQAQPLDLASYERLLREARAAAARGDRLDVEQVAPALSQARSVLMPDGSRAPVDNRWLAEELARPTPDLRLVTARLGALIDALAVTSPAAPPDAGQRLEEILARPPFEQPETAPREPSAIERFFEWLMRVIGEWLAERLGPLAPPAPAAPAQPGTLASWTLTAVAAALLVAVLVLWLRGARRTLRPESAPASPAERAAHDTADARSKAAVLAQAGDYREAARMLALAALLWLDERGALPYNPHQTNREHLARLRERPELRERLAPVVETTDRVWYGGEPLDAAGYAAVEQQVEALRDSGEGR